MELTIQEQPRRSAADLAVFGLIAIITALGFGLVFAMMPIAGFALWAIGIICLVATRRLEWVALGIFLIVPLGRLTWLDETGNLDITKFYVAALGLAWAARCLVTRDTKLLSVWTESTVTVLIIFFLLANLLSLLNAFSIGRSALSLLRLFSLFALYILVVAMVRTRREVKIAYSFLLFTGLVVCLLGVWEATTRQYLWLLLGQERNLPPSLSVAANASGGESGALRIITVFIDYNFMGGYLAVLFGLVGGALMAWRNWYLRIALVGFIGLIIYDAAQTGSRGGALGLAVAALALLLLSRVRLRWFILAAILITALVLFPMLDQLAPQFRGGISLEDLKQDQRYGYWQMAFHMMMDHPIIGVGTDNFFVLYPFYRVSPALMYRYYCHNIYLQMWAEAGIIGFIAIISLVITVILTYLKALRHATDESWRALVVGLLAAFLGYATFSATCNTLHDQPFWLLMALSVVALRATRQESESQSPRIESAA